MCFNTIAPRRCGENRKQETGLTMLLKEATAIAGSIGYPAKMPGTSYGISAQSCKVGSKLAQVEGSTCAKCYALKGNYIYPSVKTAHAKREAGLVNPLWAKAMVGMLRSAHKPKKDGSQLPPYHRWHDSGDLQSVDHLEQICIVAAETPELFHWLPTREIGILLAFIKAGGIVPANLTIRVSATMVDGNATKAWPTTSTVHHTKSAQGHDCPAIHREGADAGKCADCRACWSRDVANVSYHQH
jgi:hypothetical protein